MVHSKSEPKSVTFKKTAELHSQEYTREDAYRRNGQEDSESELTSESTITDSYIQDTLCVRKDVFKMIQKMAETSVTDTADDASSVKSSVSSMVGTAFPNASNEINGSRRDINKIEGGESVHKSIEKEHIRKCACKQPAEVPATNMNKVQERSCLCNERRQSEGGTQTEDTVLNPSTYLCHFKRIEPAISGHLATKQTENRYHRMHVSQMTAPPECSCVSSIENFPHFLQPMSKKIKKKRKPFTYCRSSSASSMPVNKEPLPGPDGIPMPSANQTQDAGTDARINLLKEEFPERVDVYYFDHGNSGYYRTTDRPPVIYAEMYMDAADETATKFWADIFGALHIGFAFVIHFILQFLRFLLFSILRPLTVGIFQLLADYFFKPLLTVLFNGVLQPILILFYNIATSFRDLCEPLAAAIGFFLKELAVLLRAFRIVEVQKIECCHTHKV